MRVANKLQKDIPMAKPKYLQPLTWSELANIYDKETGGHARTLPMEDVFAWAAAQQDKFFVDEADEGQLCLILKHTKIRS